MSNIRNAGRKSKLTTKQKDELLNRIEDGESISLLAKEYGISRQAIYNLINSDKTDGTVRLDYCFDGEITSIIEVDYNHEQVNVMNYVVSLAKRAFGYNTNPTWKQLGELLEEQFFLNRLGRSAPGKNIFLCNDCSPVDFGLEDVLNAALKDNSNDKSNVALDTSAVAIEQFLKLSKNNDDRLDISRIPRFEFTKKDILYTRTDTDGFAFKALSHDRKWFVKGQTTISGVMMDDWAVEVMASDICRQLDIPCVEQTECIFVYAGREHRGVCSRNFELDGYSFISFERLLERMGRSSREDEFIRMDALAKMRWCAKMLSKAGDLSFDDTLKYMLDLAVIDILVGNVDRHTRNFGLFYNNHEDKFEIPLIFDNGMGLFEHDDYRDRYDSFDSAMGRVYINPYGEDPFDLLKLIESEFDLVKIYPGLTRLKYNDLLHKRFATEYMERMCEHWQRLD